MENSTPENYTGCLLGGAVGDALGAPVEFMSLHQILNRYGEAGILDYVEFPDGLGRITDDTQMTLVTAEAMLRTMNRAMQRGIWGAYLQIAHDSYLRWLFTQSEPMPCLDDNRPPMTGWMIEQKEFYHRRAPGNTCLSALRSGICGTIEKPINNSKGCGGIMRVAPVGLIKSFKPADAFQFAAELAAITHGHPSGYLSAGAFAAIIAYIRDGFLLKNAVMGALNLLKKYPAHEETLRALLNAVGLSETTEPTFENIKKMGEGWVGEEALAIAVFCSLHHSNNFEKAVNLAVTHDGDTDSTGAIAGNIIGLYLGKKSIPERWLMNLEMYDFINQVGEDLFRETAGDSFTIDDEWDKKYPPN